MTTRISDATAERIGAAWPALLDALAAGELVKDVLAKHEISRPMLAAYMAERPELRRQWDAARQLSADAFMDEALEIARGDLIIGVQRDAEGNVVRDKRSGAPILIRGDSAHARTRIDALKWAARTRNPTVYGDRAQLDVNVKHLDLTAVIAEANRRLALARAGRVLDGEAHEVHDDERAQALALLT